MSESTQSTVQLEPGWLAQLAPEFEADYMRALRAFIVERRRLGKVIYPAPSNWFNAFRLTPFDRVKVVILGQDPYHGPGQAHGLCFSVPRGIPAPPSLVNIFKQLELEFGYPRPTHGCLESWAEQGVLLLNSVLTVERGAAASHQGKGWERFTDRVVEVLNAHSRGLVFMLWGAYAERKGKIIDTAKHRVLRSPHPSPLSAHRGFLGNGHFCAANAWLTETGEAPIDWRLPD